EDLVALDPLVGPRGADVEHVALDGHVDRVRVHARKVEGDDDGIATADGVHRHRGARTAPGRVGGPVELTEGIEAKQHVRASWAVWSVLTPAIQANRKVEWQPLNSDFSSEGQERAAPMA